MTVTKTELDQLAALSTVAVERVLIVVTADEVAQTMAVLVVVE